MITPVARFFPQDKVAVAFGTLTIHCTYWVEWGDDRWHVQIERLEDKAGSVPPSFERVSELVREALRGAASRRIFVEEAAKLKVQP